MRRVIDDGSDPTKPMDIDFMIACPDIQAAENIAPLADSQGYMVKISVDAEHGSVTCYCMRNMLLDYDALIATQAQLDAIAKLHHSHIDGWGTFGNALNIK